MEKAFALPSVDGIFNTVQDVCVCVCMCVCVNQMEMKQRKAIKDRKPVTPSSLTSLEQVGFRNWEISQKSL